MPLRSLAPSDLHVHDVMAPLNPEEKSTTRKRRRSASTTTTTGVGIRQEDIMVAEVFDYETPERDSLDEYGESEETEDVLKRHRVDVTEPSDDQLSEEVANLKASVQSMEKNVAKAAEKISELRDLIAVFMAQQERTDVN